MCNGDNGSKLAECLRSRRQPFTHIFDSKIGWDARGLYAFWLGPRCLYVGMSIQLRRRIYQHRMQEHNDVLIRYFRAFWSEIGASFVPLADKSEQELRFAEREAIRFLRPRANKR